MITLKQYSVVRITALHRIFDQSNNDYEFNERVPQVGDLATIIEVYNSPSLGYEMECVNEDGGNAWLITFSPKDADFEIVEI